ncbi:RICIN domain-containing protein [Streptomyces microflavus]|uniref:RICIN domain-containing protein n=1 Tax=Streptomyces microflavus TaxID=1919 RepID=UPI003B212E8E
MSQIRTLAALAASLVLIGLIAALVTTPPARPRAATTDTVQIAAGAAPATGGPVTRQEVIQRAQSWVDRKVPYSTAGSSRGPDDTGRTWRTDCSGFVSMTWRLPASETTRTLPRLTKQISRSELRPGDILNSPEHVVLFGGWIDQAKGTFTYYQESNPSRPTNKATGRLTAGELAGHPLTSYTALRYTRIIDEPTTPTPIPSTPAPSTPAPSTPAPTAAPVPSRTSAASKPAPKPKPSSAPRARGSKAARPVPTKAPAGARTWVNAATQQCLEIRHDSLQTGATANQWTCNNSATQWWKATNPSGWGTIVNANSGKCLEIRHDSLQTGATANQWDCNNSATQNWRRQARKGGGWSLINANSGKCLSIRVPGDGALADQQPCDGSTSQTWH